MVLEWLHKCQTTQSSRNKLNPCDNLVTSSQASFLRLRGHNQRWNVLAWLWQNCWLSCGKCWWAIQLHLAQFSWGFLQPDPEKYRTSEVPQQPFYGRKCRESCTGRRCRCSLAHDHAISWQIWCFSSCSPSKAILLLNLSFWASSFLFFLKL